MNKLLRAGPIVGQVIGLSAVVAGVLLLVGLAYALLVGGALVTLWGVVAEARGGA